MGSLRPRVEERGERGHGRRGAAVTKGMLGCVRVYHSAHSITSKDAESGSSNCSQGEHLCR